MLDVIVKYLHFICKNYKLFIYDNDRHELLEVTVKNTKIYWDLCKSEYINTVVCQYYLFGNILCDARDVDSFFMDMSLDRKKHTMLDLDHPETILIIEQRLLDRAIDFYYNEGKDDFIWACNPVSAEPNPEHDETENELSGTINMKMMMSIIDKKGEIDLMKLMVLYLFAEDGKIEVTNATKNKMTEGLLKGIISKESLPLEKLALIDMLNNGCLDLQELIKYKLLSSNNLDIEELMIMSCMANGDDILDILKYKMMS